MCQIFTFTNGSKLDLDKVSTVIGNKLLKSEKDGFGYAALGESGVFGEKCVDDKFFPRINAKKNKNPSKAVLKKYQSFGKPSKVIGAVMMHGRTSTNYLGLVNCHPMIKNDHYLTHNGVVDDDGPKFKAKTDTDSENVLVRFIEGIDKVEKHLTGYYAFTCIDPAGRLHVVRDRTATLHMAWINEFQTYVFATRSSTIMDIAKELECELKYTDIDEVRPDTYLIYEGNKLIECRSIESRGYEWRQARHAQKSLGRSLDDEEFEETNGNIVDMTTDSAETGDYQRSYELNGEEWDKALSYVDDTYEIVNEHGEEIEFEDFIKLDPISQKHCWLISPDGFDICYDQRGA